MLFLTKHIADKTEYDIHKLDQSDLNRYVEIRKMLTEEFDSEYGVSVQSLMSGYEVVTAAVNDHLIGFAYGCITTRMFCATHINKLDVKTRAKIAGIGNVAVIDTVVVGMNYRGRRIATALIVSLVSALLERIQDNTIPLLISVRVPPNDSPNLYRTMLRLGFSRLRGGSVNYQEVTGNVCPVCEDTCKCKMFLMQRGL